MGRKYEKEGVYVYMSDLLCCTAKKKHQKKTLLKKETKPDSNKNEKREDIHCLFDQDIEFIYPLNFSELRRKAVMLQFETADTQNI